MPDKVLEATSSISLANKSDISPDSPTPASPEPSPIEDNALASKPKFILPKALDPEDSEFPE